MNKKDKLNAGGMLDIQKNDAPNMRKDRNNRFIQGKDKGGDQVKMLLNANKLLFDEEEIA